MTDPRRTYAIQANYRPGETTFVERVLRELGFERAPPPPTPAAVAAAAASASAADAEADVPYTGRVRRRLPAALAVAVRWCRNVPAHELLALEPHHVRALAALLFSGTAC